MHAYSDGKGRTPYVDIALTLLSAAVTNWAIANLARHLELGPVPLWAYAVIALVLFGLCFWFIDWLFSSYVWRWFWSGRWTGTCNFRGEYTAKMRDADDEVVDAVLKIRQTWRKIEITLTIGSSFCKSLAAAIVFGRVDKGRRELVFTYVVSVIHPGATPLREHFGTLILERSEHGNALNGTYFTDSQSGNGGPQCANGKCLRFERVR